MKKTLCAMLAMTLLLCAGASGLCESLFVDNRETDKVYPERLNLRAEPSKNGAIIGLYYTGAEVENLGVENEEYTKVRIGGVNGYMASEYLITAQEAEARYGKGTSFGWRPAEIDLSGMWMEHAALLAQTDPQAEVYAQLENGMPVSLIGILDTWAYIAADVNHERIYGYVPLDVLTDVDELKVSIVAGASADTRTMLYDAPNDRAKEIMVLKNGAACFSLFGRKEGQWRRVRVGGVSGWIRYTQVDNLHALGSEPRIAVPYYPLLMQAKKDALLYREIDSAQYMTLGQGTQVEVLAECGDYAYIRTLEGGAGAVDCGDYGYMKIADLALSKAGTSVGVAQMDDGDLPLILLDAPDAQAKKLGALCAGAQVRVVDYTQTDYVLVALGDVQGYVLKNGVRILTGAGSEASDRIPQRATLLADTGLKAEPGKKALESSSIAKGTRVYMLGVLGDWAFVQAAVKPGLDVQDGSADMTGFVPLSALNAPVSTTHLTAFVTKDKVNLRSEGSSTQGAIIGKARLDECLRVAEYGTDWCCVATPAGKRGYIMTEYLRFE